MSSSLASNSSRIKSLPANHSVTCYFSLYLFYLSANHSVTRFMSYLRSIRCFSPDNTPGVSTSVTPLRMRDCISTHRKRDRKLFPNCCSPMNGLPEILKSHCPCILAT